MRDQDGTEIRRLEKRVERISNCQVTRSHRSSPLSKEDREAVNQARIELQRRSIRQKFLNKEYFGEGCWAILLDLFIREFDGIDVSITSSCHASGLPTTTALRCVILLVEDGLVIKEAHPTDGRSSFLRLTDQGKQTLTEVMLAARDAESSLATLSTERN